MAISTCTVSGTVKGPTNSAVTDVIVKAYIIEPFFHTDGTWIADYEVSTTVNASGEWSLTLIETATVSKTMTIAFDYPSGGTDRKRKEFTCTIPNSASVAFNTIATAAT